MTSSPLHLSAFTQAAFLALACTTTAVAQDAREAPWPDFRGPTMDGQAPAADPPLTWGEKENVTWKTAVHGRGWSSPVVAENRIWITTATKDGSELSVLALDLLTGAVLVDRVVFEVAEPEPIRNKLNSYASPSPVVEPGRVWVTFGAAGTACLDTAKAEPIWERRDLRCRYLEGPGSSPMLHGDALYLHVDGVDVQYVVALDKATGETLWSTERSTDLEGRTEDLRKAFTTPIVVEHGGRKALFSTGAEATMGYDLATGKELWKLEHPGFSQSSRAVIGDGLVFLNTGFMRPELWALRLAGPDHAGAPERIWKITKRVPTMASPVFVDGLLFMINDTGVASCIDAKTGDSHWEKRVGAEFSASALHADGRVYFFDRAGKATVVNASKTFERLAENTFDEGFMASPAAVGDALILRTRTHLYRVEED